MTRGSIAKSDRASVLLTRRIRQFRAEIRGAFDGDERAIHQLRTAARRLRAILPLLANKPDGRHVRGTRRMLQQLTRAFGESRDLDVGLPLLEARVAALGASRELRAVVARLRSARAKARRHTQRAVSDFDLDELRHELRALRGRIAGSTRALERARRERALRGRNLLGRLSALNAQALDGDDTDLEAEALHAVRIRARRLRYVAETLDALHARKTPAAGLLKQFQDELGKVHDAHVLADWLGAQADALDAHRERTAAAQARALSRFFAGQSRTHYQAFVRTRPSARLRRALAILRASDAQDPVAGK